MTDKQFNYILRRLRQDIIRALDYQAFPTKDDSVYVDGVMVVCMEDVYTTLNTHFSELIEDE